MLVLLDKFEIRLSKVHTKAVGIHVDIVNRFHRSIRGTHGSVKWSHTEAMTFIHVKSKRNENSEEEKKKFQYINYELVRVRACFHLLPASLQILIVCINLLSYW